MKEGYWALQAESQIIRIKQIPKTKKEWGNESIYYSFTKIDNDWYAFSDAAR